MPNVDNRGVHIRYEMEGQGMPLVLQYGQYWPLEIWYEHDYVEHLKRNYQLILVDARGQGASDKPYDAVAYQVEHMASDIIAVLDDLGLTQVHYMGYSSGGRLGFELARLAPHRFYSLIIGGIHPYAEHRSGLEWHSEQIQKLEQQSAEDFVSDIEQLLTALKFPPLSPRLKEAMLRHDPHALIGWHHSFPHWPSYADMLETLTIPCLLYAGEEDDVYPHAREAASAIPDATFVPIPKAGHLEPGKWIDVLEPEITAFIQRVHPA